jgi:hypothetical protein
MAYVQIPNLPAVVGLAGTELFEGVQAGSSVKISLNQIIAATRSGTPSTLPLLTDVGGTGLTTFDVGDIMYASNNTAVTGQFAKLSDVATGNALISGGVGAAPSYGKIGLTTHVSGVLPVANGGTNQSANLTQYGVIYGDTATSMASTAAGTSVQVLHGNASGSPTWGSVSLTADVSGILPVANGGTNISSYTTGDIIYASTAGVLSPLADVATGNAIISGGVGAAPSYGKIGLTTHVDGVLPAANGGTGLIGSLVQYGIVYGATTTNMASTTAGTSTQVLHGNASGAPTFGAVSLTADVSGELPLANGGTGINAVSTAAVYAALLGYTATATAAGTTTLTNTSTQYQLFTGSTTQTIVLPVTSTLTTGWTFHIVNNSTGSLTVNSSGGNLVCTVIAGMTAMVTCIGTALTTAADWEFGFTDFGSVTGTGAVVLGTGPTITAAALNGTVGATTPSTGVFTTLSDSAGNVRDIVSNAKTSAYVLALTDNGEMINITTGGVTVNSGIFSAGNNVTIYNNSAASQTITQGAGVTLRLAGSATTGNRTLALRGICTIVCVASNEFVVSGAGLT